MKNSLYVVGLILLAVFLFLGVPALVAVLINSHTDIGLVALLALVCSFGAFLGYRKVKINEEDS